MIGLKKTLMLQRVIMGGERVPRGYGIAYRDFLMDAVVCYPVPLNWLVRWGRDLARRLKVPTATKWEGMLVAAYQKGFERGREDAVTSMLSDLANAVDEAIVERTENVQAEADRASDDGNGRH
jgi:hypothetical protein